ncbi:hypothetical protein TMEN_6826 [Trichophyton mentagrophytes]|nr:hypothetical protein TMEN_6826 [Trichophyton mentagrophytes]
MFTYMRRDDQRPSSVACAPPPASSQPPPRPSSDSFAASNSTLTDGIFESGIWTAEPDLNSAFNSGKWFSDEKICCCPGKTVPPSPEEKIVVTEYELRDNWLANDRYHSNVSSMYGSTQNSPSVGVGVGAGAGAGAGAAGFQHSQHHQNQMAAPENTSRSSSTWRWTLGKGSSSSPSDSLKGSMGDGGYSPGAVASRSSSKPSPDTSSSAYAGESRGFLRESGNGAAKKHQQHQQQHQQQQHHHSQEVVEVPSSKGTKTRLNLLNPMALLARRRSAHPASARPEDISISKLTVPALPDDYDPRIRGSLVHDFSVPRARSNMADGSNARSRQLRELPDNPPRPQRPPQQAQQTQITTPAPYRQINRASVELPPKPQAESQQLPIQTTPKADVDIMQQQQPTSPPPPQQQQQQQQQQPQQNAQDTSSIHTRSPPSTLRYKPGSVRDPSFVPLGLPRHLTSSASRFSFDLAGAASSSQEKLMEERHKEKEAAKRAMGTNLRSEFDDDSDEFDYDAMMDDDGLEEKIPGINADADSIDESDTAANPALQNYMKSYAPTLSTVMSSPTSPPGNGSFVPMANNGVSMPPGFIMSSNQPGLSMYSGFQQPVPPAMASPELPTTNQEASRGNNGEDDLYYDDGLFGELPPEMQGSTIDESIFDDETSYLYDNKRRAAQPPQALSEESTAASHDNPIPMPQNSVVEARPAHNMDKPPSQFQGLTEGNLEAYHSALAQAANEAARKGRFERNASLSETSLPEGESQTDPCLTTDESRMSQTVDTDALGMDDPLDDFDYYDGDGLDDDPIIAEANADVLEHDDEGFYGREFGFYAHAHGSDDKERVYGGYFGAPGSEGIIRNHSGRKNFREPSLTPITERSEWSTRNSIVSLAAHAGHSSHQQQPPLAQLVDMEVPDDEISLSALMKLRRGAWGGSNGSLRSNTGGSQGAASPSAAQPHRGSLTHYYDTGSPVQSSGLINGGGNSEVNSPTHADKEFTPDPRAIRRHSDTTRPPSSWDPANRHSLRTEDEKSGPMSPAAGERISYVRSRDESGSEYWVLERRRTGDGGESEVLERETMKLRI